MLPLQVADLAHLLTRLPLVQNECIPQAILGTDVLCQAKSGMGKTAVFVISVLQQIYPVSEDDGVKALVLCHTRELAYQISNEFDRFKKHMEGVRVECLYGGVPIKTHKEMLKNNTPHVIISTPGRCKHLLETGDLNLTKLKHFVLDECDRMLESLGMSILYICICADLLTSMCRHAPGCPADLPQDAS